MKESTGNCEKLGICGIKGDKSEILRINLRHKESTSKRQLNSDKNR
jgi:hypothetical protein